MVSTLEWLHQIFLLFSVIFTISRDYYLTNIFRLFWQFLLIFQLKLNCQFFLNFYFYSFGSPLAQIIITAFFIFYLTGKLTFCSIICSLAYFKPLFQNLYIGCWNCLNIFVFNPSIKCFEFPTPLKNYWILVF